MPEMPEVQGLVDFLGERVAGRTITRVSVAAIAALKTFDPPVSALQGAVITGTARHGKFIDIAMGEELHLVFHLAKAGWLRWYDELPKTLIKPGRSPHRAARRARRREWLRSHRGRYEEVARRVCRPRRAGRSRYRPARP